MHSIDNLDDSDEAHRARMTGGRATAGAGCQGRRMQSLNEKYLGWPRSSTITSDSPSAISENRLFGNEQILKELLPCGRQPRASHQVGQGNWNR